MQPQQNRYVIDLMMEWNDPAEQQTEVDLRKSLQISFSAAPAFRRKEKLGAHTLFFVGEILLFDVLALYQKVMHQIIIL